MSEPQVRELNALAYTLQALYAAEINCGLSSFWDGGWTFWIGDEANGRVEETFSPDQLWKGVQWLCDAAIAAYPGSEFAQLAMRARTRA